MFVISQVILHKSNMCKVDNISTYAIATGLVIYAAIYLYLLFYNNEYISLFNKFIIYIIGIDLLLSTFYYFNTSSQKKHSDVTRIESNNSENLFEKIGHEVDDQNLAHSDCESEHEEESDFEIETEVEAFHEQQQDPQYEYEHVQQDDQQQYDTELDHQLEMITTEHVQAETAQPIDILNEETIGTNEYTIGTNEYTNEKTENEETTTKKRKPRKTSSKTKAVAI